MCICRSIENFRHLNLSGDGKIDGQNALEVHILDRLRVT